MGAMIRTKRRDENQADLVAILRAAGWSWQDTSQVGGGAPDGVAGHPRWGNVWIEVKPPLGARGGASGRTLRAVQDSWWFGWRGPKPVILRTPDDVALLTSRGPDALGLRP